MNYKISILAILQMAFIRPCSAQINAYNYHSQKKLRCTKGAVVSAHPLASKVGITILKKGGNAFDAAIATQLVLAVVYPGAGNIGGGGFMVAHCKNGRNIAIDFRETAALKASRNMYLDTAGNPNLVLSKDGHLACGVPGTIAGLAATSKYARLPLKTLIQPAIDLAKNGFAITARQAKELNNLKTIFTRLNTAPVAFVKEQPWKTGDTLTQKELAATLERIRDLGTNDFYEGKTALLIATEMFAGKGIISLDDLKYYRSKERVPLEFDYKKNHIISMPLPSSGGIILQQVLKMIERKDIAALKFQTAESVQLMTEVERRAYADRAKYLGDADFVKVPVKELLSDTYLKERMADYTPGEAGNSKTIKEGMIHESEETTHISIVDQEGNSVAVTTTLNGSYGSKVVVTGAGFILNNEMDDFSVKPGVPNMYGAIGAEANAIAPGKRMLSSMTPTIVLQNNQPYIITGTPGGTTIPTSVFQTLVNLVDFKMTAEDAVNKPKFHHQWLPDEIFTEAGFDTATKKKLETMGYKVTTREDIGRVELILVNKKRKDRKNKLAPKEIIAIADKRGDDAAEGY